MEWYNFKFNGPHAECLYKIINKPTTMETLISVAKRIAYFPPFKDITITYESTGEKYTLAEIDQILHN